MKNNCGDDGIPIVLVGNKCDSPDKIVSKEDQEQYARLMNLTFFEASAKDNLNVDEVFVELTRLVLARQERTKQINDRTGYVNVSGSPPSTSKTIPEKKCY